MESLINIGQCEDSPKQISSAQVGVRLILEERVKNKQAQLDEINSAIKFLDENPTFERGFDLLKKALRY